jgi:hypothetical protein
MEWLVDAFLVLMFALCAFGMLRMIVGGWLRGGRHGGHGMMGCMGHGAHDERRTSDKRLVEELKAERHRLDALIARAEREAADQADL